MSQHPDRWYAAYIESGLREGFRIGFRYEDCICTSVKANMHSAVKNSEIIDSYLGKELSMGRVLGPLDPRVGAQMQVSRFGVIPKNQVETNFGPCGVSWYRTGVMFIKVHLSGRSSSKV